MARWPAVLVFGALPTVGLVAGPSYAALIFGFAAVQLTYGIAIERRFPTAAIDPALCLLAAIFATLCWVSVSWAIDPARSLRAALEITAIFVGAIALLAGPPLDEAITDQVFRTLFIATMLGAAIIAADSLLGHRLQPLIARPSRSRHDHEIQPRHRLSRPDHVAAVRLSPRGVAAGATLCCWPYAWQ